MSEQDRLTEDELNHLKTENVRIYRALFPEHEDWWSGIDIDEEIPRPVDDHEDWNAAREWDPR